MQKQKKAKGSNQPSSAKYEGMFDAKTGLASGGGRNTQYSQCDEGHLKIVSIRTGAYKAGSAVGHYGKQQWKDAHYEGEFVDGKIDGIGKYQNMRKGCQETYSGEWKAGVFHGFGKYVNFDKNCMYIGEHKDGLIHGHGRAEYSNGSSYEGDF